MTLLGAHQALAWVFVIGNGIAGVWALGATRRPALERPALWWFTAAVEFVATPQAVLGALIITTQDRAAPDMHIFYGAVVIMTVGVLFSYRQQLGDKLLLLYGGGGLFLMGLGIRAMLLGPT